MKRVVVILALLISLATSAFAQVSVPNTFVTGTRILASEMNANFDALESGSLNRAGGTVTGNIVVDNGITIDGIDVGAVLGGTGTPTFSTVTTTGVAAIAGDFSVNTNKFTVTAASGNTLVAGTLEVTGAQTFTGATALNGAVDIAAGLTAGSGNVAILDATGKIPAISSTYFTSLSGTNLTGVALLGTANTFTAKNNLLTYTETKVVLTPAAAITVDLSLGSHFTLSNTTTATLTFSNPATSGLAGSFTLAVTGNGASHPITWPASVLWANNIAPTLTVTNAKTDILTFITYDGGTTWYGFVGGQNF